MGKSAHLKKKENKAWCLTRMCVSSKPVLSVQWNDLWNIEGYPGVKIGEHKVSNMRYADDAVLIAENKEDLPQLLDIAEEESRRKRFELKSKKTSNPGRQSNQWVCTDQFFISQNYFKYRDQCKVFPTNVL